MAIGKKLLLWKFRVIDENIAPNPNCKTPVTLEATPAFLGKYSSAIAKELPKISAIILINEAINNIVVIKDIFSCKSINKKLTIICTVIAIIISSFGEFFFNNPILTLVIAIKIIKLKPKKKGKASVEILKCSIKINEDLAIKIKNPENDKPKVIIIFIAFLWLKTNLNDWKIFCFV